MRPDGTLVGLEASVQGVESLPTLNLRVKSIRFLHQSFQKHKKVESTKYFIIISY